MPDPTGRRRAPSDPEDRGDTLDVVDLGESTIRGGLTVDPVPVRDGPRGLRRFRRLGVKADDVMCIVSAGGH